MLPLKLFLGIIIISLPKIFCIENVENYLNTSNYSNSAGVDLAIKGAVSLGEGIYNWITGR